MSYAFGKKYKMEWEKKMEGGNILLWGLPACLNQWIDESFVVGSTLRMNILALATQRKKKKKVCMSEKVAGFTQTNVENIKSMYKFKINVKI